MIDASPEAVPFAFATALALTLMVVMAGDIGENVQEPADKLLADHGAGCDDRSLFHQLGELVGIIAQFRGVLVPRLGNEDHITLEVTGGLVVFAMRDLPREVRDQQSGMAEPADGIVEGLGWREGLMAALVGQHP